MARKLNMLKDVETRELIEGHPLGVKKIIKGDLREKTWIADGVTYSSTNTNGTLLYDAGDTRDRPWFVLAFESGERIVDE